VIADEKLMLTNTTTQTDKPRRLLRGVGWTVGVLVIALVVFLVRARIVGLDPGPAGRETLGLWLSGELVTTPVTDWSFAKDVPMTNTAVQVNWRFFPLISHSHRTGRWHYKDRLYYGTLYPGGVPYGVGRFWNQDVAVDNRVRIKIRDKLYDVKFTPVTDPAERELILPLTGSSTFHPGEYMFLWRVDPR
jgi:hypothetical protein